MRNNITTGKSSDVKGNAAQMEAILHKDGPAMVLAGPGSGKTFVIVERLRHLITRENVDPSSILVITFTKAAAIEMQQRFMKITDSSYPEVSFGTFHSVFYQIIRRSNPHTKLQIISENTKYKLLRDIILRLKASGVIKNSETEDVLEILGDVISEISRIKNTMESPSNNSLNGPGKLHFKRIYEEYNKSLSEFNLIDFDDMLLNCFELFKKDTDTLGLWQKKFRYILIDEYQDINLLQYRIIDQICESKNLFVVGDDDQSIYGFRGSDPGIMQQFPEEYRDFFPKIISLDTNYRCGKVILDTAMRLIEENTVRYKKVLRADNSNGKGFLIPRRYTSKKHQSSAIVSFLKSHKDSYDRIAFIFRTNQEAYSLASVLKAEGIPTNLEGNAKEFYESPAVKLCIDYLSFACVEKSRELFFRIMNKPLRYISRECAQQEVVSECKVKSYYRGNSKMQKVIDKFFRQVGIIAKMRPTLSVRFLRNELGIDTLYPGEIDALNELSEKTVMFESNKELIGFIKKAIDESGQEVKNKGVRNKKDCVKLMTMHGSKGLEFDIVWLPNLNEGIIPSRSSITKEQIEEERRMLYVGMTRAKTALVMSYLTGSSENPMLPSRFLRPLRDLWEEKDYSSSPSRPSSGSSTSSSNSTSSR
ncbi:MAG: ATP-dependent helicase [Butyrivibrio sp.]|nr:ATP-dependent helicase [Butyrivibrio sp.]